MPKLLIIDDEEGIVHEVVDYFEEEGFQVKFAHTGEQGFSLFDKHDPDIVLLDMRLPDISGLEVLKRIRKSERNCKVLVNTGYVDPSMMDQASEMGYDGFLAKPFNLIKIKEMVDQILRSECQNFA